MVHVATVFAVGDEALLAEQVRYYRARANEYDEGYARTGKHDRGPECNADWFREFGALESRFEKSDIAGDIVEFAAGTGHWTAQLAARAGHVTALDAAPETLALNREGLRGRSDNVDFEVVDLLAWQPARTWDGAVGFFWLCHIPDDRLPSFLEAVRRALRPGGTVFFGDKSADGARTVETELRTLNDGRTFTIFDHPRTPDELDAAFRQAGFDVDVVRVGKRFTVVEGTATAG
jgi:demethylmenaquinone methyltransferase/2-methoxy-6-polyprenyl-1,4-benzoquinol methylase